MLEEYRRKVVGTNIDQGSLLTTDYFNTFNSVIMVLDMLPDAPDMLEEAEQWQFYDYVEHYKHSGLDFADLAIAAYEHSPPDLRAAFERKINGIRVFIEDIIRTSRRLLDAGENEIFIEYARFAVMLLHRMVEEGNGIVHGASGAMDQSAIDNMF